MNIHSIFRYMAIYARACIAVFFLPVYTYMANGEHHMFHLSSFSLNGPRFLFPSVADGGAYESLCIRGAAGRRHSGGFRQGRGPNGRGLGHPRWRSAPVLHG